MRGSGGEDFGILAAKFLGKGVVVPGRVSRVTHIRFQVCLQPAFRVGCGKLVCSNRYESAGEVGTRRRQRDSEGISVVSRGEERVLVGGLRSRSEDEYRKEEGSSEAFLNGKRQG